MDRIKIRYASQDDLPAIVPLMNQLGYSSDEQQIRDRILEIRERNGDVIVAVKDGSQIVGCVQALLDVRLAEGKIGEIVSLVVKSDMRGQGIGTQLFLEAKKWLHQAGCATIRIRANAVRDEAHQFYKKHGFEEIKTQKIFQLSLH